MTGEGPDQLREFNRLTNEADSLNDALESLGWDQAEEQAKQDSIAKAQEILSMAPENIDSQAIMADILKVLTVFEGGGGDMGDIIYAKAFLGSLADRLEERDKVFDDLVSALREQALVELEIAESE